MNKKGSKENFVRLTRPLLSKVFQECNQLYFENKLPMPDCFDTWTPSKYIAGWIRAYWMPKQKRWGTAIHISKGIRWTRENLRDTMVHEMIHLEIQDYRQKLSWWRRLFHKDHNQEFKDRMNQLNSLYGLNVMIVSKHLRAYMIKPSKG